MNSHQDAGNLLTLQMMAEQQARQRAKQNDRPLSPRLAKRLREQNMGLRAARYDN